MAELEERTQYEGFASQYELIATVPQGQLEAEFIIAALGSIKGQTVLDLGGGTGLHARKAVAAGASLVDLVDISPEMLKLAKEAEEREGRKDVMRFFVADAVGDLSKLGLHDRYDVVMVNWLFDHAQSDEDLEGFWRNISRYAKPGGKFLGTRLNNPKSRSAAYEPKYGIEMREFKDIAGGLAYKVHVHSTPELEFESTSMEKIYSGSTVMHEKFGFENVQTIKPEEMEVVKRDPAFWQLFVDDPWFSCVTARKKA